MQASQCLLYSRLNSLHETSTVVVQRCILPIAIPMHDQRVGGSARVKPSSDGASASDTQGAPSFVYTAIARHNNSMCTIDRDIRGVNSPKGGKLKCKTSAMNR